jgi:hypothetical protein
VSSSLWCTILNNDCCIAGGKEQRRLLALASKERLIKILEKMLDEDEFLSEYGIRSCVSRALSLIRRRTELLPCDSLSKHHKDNPWGMNVNGDHYEVGYWPGDSKSGMFGGNSNWRGPICTLVLLLFSLSTPTLHL